MRKINKVIVWLKKLPIGLIGLVAFIGIMLLLTAAFNWFWSGLGKDSTHHYILPLATSFNDFKEYTALYISLISFGATLFAGFVVFLVFNDWKEQHNKTEDAKLAKELYLILEQEKNAFRDFNVSVKRLSEEKTSIITTVNTQPLLQEITDEIITKMLFIKSNLTIFKDLTNDEEFRLKNNLHDNSITSFSDYWIDKFKIPTTIDKKIANENNGIITNHIENITQLQKILKSYIKVI